MSDSNTLSVLQPLESFLNERVQAADAWIRRTDVSNNEELTSHLFGVSKTAALGDWVTGTESPVRPVGQGIAGRVMAAQSPLWVVDDSAEPSPSAEVVADVVDGSTRQMEGRSLGVKTMFGVPIFHRSDAKNPEAGRFEGALCFYSTEVIPESSEIARELLAAASAVAANFTFPNEGQIPTATRGDDGATTATPAPPGELSDFEEQAGADTAAPPLRPPMVFPFMDGGCGCGGRGVVGGAGTAAGLTAAAAGALSSAGFPAGASPSFFQVMEQLQAAAQFQQQLQQQGGVGGGGGEARDGQQQGAADAAMAAAAASLGFSPEQLQLSQQALLEHQIQWQHEQQQQQQQQQQLLSMQIQSHLGIGQGMLSPSILQGLASGATSLPPGFPSALSSQLSSQLLQQGSPFLQAFSSQPLQPQQPLQPLPPSSSSSSSSSAQPGAGQQQLAEMANWADIAPAMAAGAFSQQALETIESALNQQTSAAAKASKRKSGSSSSSSSSSSDDAGGAASAGGNASSSAKAAAWATGTAGGTGSNRVKGVGCAQEGCHKIAQGGTTMCIAHGGGRRCTHPGCSRGARDRFFCASHGGGKRCQSEGCGKSAVGATAFCTAHGGGKRCQSESCNKSAQSSTNFCVRHGGGRKCKSSGCEKVARGRTDHCAAHGGGTRCSASGCRKAALGGTALCRSHTQQEQQHAVAGVEGAALYAAAHAAAVVPAGTMTGSDPTAAAFAEYAMNNGVVAAAAAAAAAAAGSGGTGVGLEEIAASAVPRAIAAGVKRARDESSGDGVAEEDSEKEKGAKVSAVVASQCV